MATDTFNFKRGQTFGASCTYVPQAGGPPDLTGVSIASSIKDSSGVLYDTTVVITDPTHFSVRYSDTSCWRVGTAYWDIKFSVNDIIFMSETVVINVVPNVTPVA
jgi:hypothetical protein